jgi:phage terminase large subunit-like protein
VPAALLAGPNRQLAQAHDGAALTERVLAVVTTRWCGRRTGRGELAGDLLVDERSPD